MASDNLIKSASLLNDLLLYLRGKAKAGVTLQFLEDEAAKFLRMHDVKSSFMGYYGYPANTCLSVNDCVVHGFPDKTVLKDGDVLKIDAGVKYKWSLSDSAITIIVWWNAKNPQWAALIKATKEALDGGLEYVQAGRSVYDFWFFVNNYIKSKGFVVIKNLTGHGISKTLHEEPYVYNYAEPKSKNVFFREGQIVCLEPITAIRSTRALEKRNVEHNLYCEKWDIGVQREYMVEVTKHGPKILSGITEL